MSETDITRRDHASNWKRETNEDHIFQLQRFRGYIIEVEDVHFHHDSAVFLPDYGDAPDPKRITGLSILATAYQHAEKNPTHQLLDAGHTDTSGKDAYNLTLSVQRADSVLHALLGNRSAWVAVSLAKHKVEDYQQIVKWTSWAYGWDSDPGPIDNVHGSQTTAGVKGFQRNYNNTFGGSLVVDGVVGEKTWGAIFDVYMDYLKSSMEVDDAGLAAARARLVFLGPKRVGCGENFPIDSPRKNDYRSKINRRVELLFYEPDQVPKLDCHPGSSCDPILCEVYNPLMYKYTHITPTPKPAKKVTVLINLLHPVACPGHPLAITAVGTPPGGDFAWTVADAELVDSLGSEVTTGDTVNLRFFKADDKDGSIPEHQATVSVTYTHPDGTATASKPVKVHKIDFEISDKKITTGFTVAKELGGVVSLEGVSGSDTMVTDPKVKIKLDASCPRKADCAQNYRVGWLQTVTTNERTARYTHTLVSVVVPLPIRDGDPFAGPSPFPFYDAAPDFTGDGDTEKAHHFDSPGNGATLLDPRAAAPAPTAAKPKNRQLRGMVFKNMFTAWLVVQNKEWSDNESPPDRTGYLKGSFAFQQHFDWEINYTATVDMSKAVGKKVKPKRSAMGKLKMTKGKGGGDPNLEKTTPNEEAQKPGATHIDPAPELP